MCLRLFMHMRYLDNPCQPSMQATSLAHLTVLHTLSLKRHAEMDTCMDACHRIGRVRTKVVCEYAQCMSLDFLH